MLIVRCSVRLRDEGELAESDPQPAVDASVHWTSACHEVKPPEPMSYCPARPVHSPATCATAQTVGPASIAASMIVASIAEAASGAR